MNKKSLRGQSSAGPSAQQSDESPHSPAPLAAPRKSAAARMPKYPFVPVEAGREIISIDQAIEDFRRGRTLIVVDDENRENEGDFMFGASFATTERVNFLLRHAKGLICVASTLERLRELQLEKMVTSNTAKHGTNFTVTVDHRETSTGISAPDRALTIQAMADPMTQPDDLLRPGHICPLGAVQGGVLVRAGHTEASIDLSRLAGLQPCAVLCEILKENGQMARLPDLRKLARRFQTPIVTIRDLIAYRIRREHLVRRVLSTQLPNRHGVWRLHLYDNALNQDEHLALVMGKPEKQKNGALVRVHSKCLTGDTLGSLRCDCGPQLDAAMELIAKEGHGVILYLDQEGRGIGLANKLRAYVLQDQGKDTVEANEALGFEADLREYGIGAQILADLGLRRIRIMTNNPKKIIGIQGFNLEVVDRVPLIAGWQDINKDYLRAKAEKMGHLIEVVSDRDESPKTGGAKGKTQGKKAPKTQGVQAQASSSAPSPSPSPSSAAAKGPKAQPLKAKPKVMASASRKKKT